LANANAREKADAAWIGLIGSKEIAMRDMVYEQSSSVSTPRQRLWCWIELAGKRLRVWIETQADRAAEAALYQELSRLSDAELEHRGIPRGELHRCVFGDGPTGLR
jgi:hypothetical protein